jgi:hypothetical protein
MLILILYVTLESIARARTTQTIFSNSSLDVFKAILSKKIFRISRLINTLIWSGGIT